MKKTETKDEQSQDLSPSEQTAHALFDFSINREDVKYLLEQPPTDHKISRDTMEYELQMLKIITTGWSISFYLADHPMKMEIAESYWDHVHNFSDTITSTTELTMGKKLDYFNALKDRLDAYLDSLKEITKDTDPLNVIGPEFAKFCGDKDDVFAILTGSKLFALTLKRVRDYLEETDQEEVS